MALAVPSLFTTSHEQRPQEVRHGLAGGGNDNVYGEAGNDHLWGDHELSVMGGVGASHTDSESAGDDFMDGGAGDDHLDGEGGSDLMYGGTGDDWMHANLGEPSDTSGDEMFGQGGNDTIGGSDGHDSIWGGTGADSIFGNGGNDTISHAGGTGSPNDNAIDSIWGHDRFVGKEGGDVYDSGYTGAFADWEDGSRL